MLSRILWFECLFSTLDDVEIDLLRSPQSFEDMLLRRGYIMMDIINAQVIKKSIPGCLALGIRLLIFTDLPSLQRFAYNQFTSLAIHPLARTMD